MRQQKPKNWNEVVILINGSRTSRFFGPTTEIIEIKKNLSHLNDSLLLYSASPNTHWYYVTLMYFKDTGVNTRSHTQMVLSWEEKETP